MKILTGIQPSASKGDKELEKMAHENALKALNLILNEEIVGHPVANTGMLIIHAAILSALRSLANNKADDIACCGHEVISASRGQMVETLDVVVMKQAEEIELLKAQVSGDGKDGDAISTLKNVISLLLRDFQGRATGFAKQNTQTGNAISNEYLGIISDIEHATGLAPAIDAAIAAEKWKYELLNIK
jgi:hypothetical protein